MSIFSGSPTKPRSTTSATDAIARPAGLARDHHVAVLAAKADGLAAGLVDVADDLLVDRAGQHHLDDLDGRGVGDAQAAGELRLDAEPVEHRRDLRAAAMHDHRIDRGLFEQHDVAGEFARGFFLAHGVAAVFDHDDFLVVALHMRQRFGEDAGLVVRGNRHCLSPWREWSGLAAERCAGGIYARQRVGRCAKRLSAKRVGKRSERRAAPSPRS